MTISNTPRKAGPYAGNGSATTFAFAFKVFSAADVLVVRAVTATGVETTLALTTDYTVTLNADQDTSPGGTITTTTAPAAGQTITLSSDMDYTQPVELTNNGGFYPSVINAALDRLTIFAQQLAEQVGRAVKTDISSTKTADEMLAEINDAATASSAAASSAGASATSAANSAAEAAASAASAVTLTGTQTLQNKTLDSTNNISGASGHLASMRNKIINGWFAVNQRAYVSGAAVGAGLYGHDRWKMAASGDTYTFSSTANKTTVTIPAGKVLQQVVEGLNLQTGTYTLSWEGTAQGKIGAGAYGASGITGSITGGTNTTIEFGPGTVANVQLEFGLIATPFEQRPIQTELALCQRYYNYATLWVPSSSSAMPLAFMYPVEMRVTPSITGGGAGFTGSGTAKGITNVVQTTGAAQSLVFGGAEL